MIQLVPGRTSTIRRKAQLGEETINAVAEALTNGAILGYGSVSVGPLVRAVRSEAQEYEVVAPHNRVWGGITTSDVRDAASYFVTILGYRRAGRVLARWKEAQR